MGCSVLMAHIPVMLNEVLNVATPCFAEGRGNTAFLDCTLGRAGHFQAILNKFPGIVTAIGLDQDLEAISAVQSAPWFRSMEQSRIQLQHQSLLLFEPQGQQFDFILVDLGVSSPQLDQAERGFSFYHDGPLDMRMNQGGTTTAADLLNTLGEQPLIELFKTYGEIERPERVVRAIVHDRKQAPWESTLQLASLIERVDGWRTKGKHPATLYFLALRMAVNNELEQVEQGLPRLIQFLKPGGRLAVISFHSLEDRIVKFLFQGRVMNLPGEPIKRKAFKPSDEELEKNPRARSALLRVFEKSTGAPGSRKKKFKHNPED